MSGTSKIFVWELCWGILVGGIAAYLQISNDLPGWSFWALIVFYITGYGVRVIGDPWIQRWKRESKWFPD